MIYIILSLVLYTAITLVGTSASRNTNPFLVGAIEAVVSGVVALAVMFPILGRREYHTSKFGIIMAVLSGVMVGLFTLTLVKSFSFNKVGIVAPVVLGGSIFLSTALSYFLFKEKISLLQAIGLALMGGGLTVLIYARAVGK